MQSIATPKASYFQEIAHLPQRSAKSVVPRAGEVPCCSLAVQCRQRRGAERQKCHACIGGMSIIASALPIVDRARHPLCFRGRSARGIPQQYRSTACQGCGCVRNVDADVTLACSGSSWCWNQEKEANHDCQRSLCCMWTCRADGWDIRGRWFGVVVCGHTAAGSVGARRDDSMARGRDLDRTARNAVTGVDQRRIVPDYAIELPLFRGPIAPEAVIPKVENQPRSAALMPVSGPTELILAIVPPCAGECRLVRVTGMLIFSCTRTCVDFVLVAAGPPPPRRPPGERLEDEPPPPAIALWRIRLPPGIGK